MLLLIKKWTDEAHSQLSLLPIAYQPNVSISLCNNTNVPLLNERRGQRLEFLSIQQILRYQTKALWCCTIWLLNAWPGMQAQIHTTQASCHLEYCVSFLARYF